MPGSTFAEVEIAGVELEDGGLACKCYIIDGHNLQSDHLGYTRFPANPSAASFTQIFATTKGRRFGILALSITTELLDDVVDAINQAMNGGAGNFNVTASDARQSFNGNVKPDYSQESWISYPGEVRTNEKSNLNTLFRFVTD
jgi:hypothetical protein